MVPAVVDQHQLGLRPLASERPEKVDRVTEIEGAAKRAHPGWPPRARQRFARKE